MKFASWIRNAAAGASRRKERKRRVKRELLADLCITPLETRRVLNGDGVASELVVDAGESAGDGKSDTFHIEIDDDQVNVSVNGKQVASGNTDQLKSLTIVGSSDDDRVVTSLGDGLLAGIDLNLNLSAGEDSLQLVSQQHIDSLIHTLNQPSTGESVIQFGQSAGNLRHSGVEHVQHDLSVNSFSIELGTGSNDVRLGVDSDTASLSAEVRHVSADGVLSETHLGFEAPTRSLVMTSDANGTADQITVTGLSDSFDADLLVFGDASDSFLIAAATDLGTSDLDVRTGRVDVNAQLTSQGGNLTLHGSEAFGLSEDADISAFGGAISVEGTDLQIDGTVRSQGGIVRLDSGIGGTTILRGLVDVSDTSANRGVGGTVEVLGMQVALLDQARIDASGTYGGGKVLIGGGFQGADPLVRNAEKTVVAANVAVVADAIHDGNGGTIILWADQWTRFHGSLSARGGSGSGDGGFVEVSGKQTLEYRGSTDVSAVAGQAGTLLLDPTDITIEDNATNDDGEISGDQEVLFADPGASVVLQPAAFEDFTGQIIIQATNDITVNSAINLSEDGAVLRLQAGNNININAAITGSANNSLFLEADSPHSGGSDGMGTLTIADVAVDSADGDITLIAAAFSFDTNTDADIIAGAGNIDLTLTQGSAIQLGGGGATLGNDQLKSFSTSGTLTIGRATSAGTNDLGAGAAEITTSELSVNSSITLANSVSGTVAFVTSGQFTVANSGDVTADAAAIHITANEFENDGGIDSKSRTTTIVDIDGSGIILGATAVANNISISDNELQSISATGLILSTTGSILVNDISAAKSNNISGVTSLVASGAGSTVTFQEDASTFNSLAVQAGGGITINGDLSTDVGSLTINADSDESGSGTITVADDVTVDSDGESLNLTAAAITLGSNAAFDSGDGVTTITESSGDGIGLGMTPVSGGLNFDAAAIANFTAAEFTFVTAGNIVVDGVASGTLPGTTTLQGATISFVNNASVFDALDVQAGMTLAVNQDLTSEMGNIALSGTDIAFAADVVIDADNTLSLDESNTDGISASGALTLTANNGITLNDSLDAQGALAIDADANDNSTGVLSIGADVTVSTTTGNGLTLEGHDITFENGAAIESGSTLTLNEGNNDGIAASGVLTLQAVAGITISDSIGTDGNVEINADSDADGTGTLIVADGATLSTNDHSIEITAADLDLSTSGAVNSGAAATTINDSADGGISLGPTNSLGGLHLTGNELQRITSTGLTLDTGDQINVNGITAAQSGGISGTVTLQATGNITFETSASTFNSIDVQSDGTVAINADTNTVDGNLVLSGDDLSFGDGVTLQSATTLSLGENVPDGMEGSGSLSLVANDGISINDSLTTSDALVINADLDDMGGGTLTVADGATVSTSNNLLSIHADDLDLSTSGQLNSGTAETLITDSDGTGIDLGDTDDSGGIHITGAELQRISATGLSLSTTGNIFVDNISAANSNGISGVLTLSASGATSNISFSDNASTFNSLNVEANAGVSVSVDLSTDSGSLTINADFDTDGAGTLTLADNVAIDTNDSLLDITVDAVSLGTGASLDSGTATTTIRESNGDGIGLGATPIVGGLNFNATSLANFTAAGFTFETAGDIIVDGVNTAIIAGDTTLMGNNVHFNNNASSFDSLDVQATTAVNINQNLSTLTGDLILGGNDLTFAASVAVTSATSLTLDENNNDGIVANGVLSLTADDGITLSNSLNALGDVTINADADANDQDGTFSIASGQTLSAVGNAIDITANDLNFDGSVTAATINITDSDGTGIALGGNLADGISISGDELQNLTATSLTLATPGAITVEGITQTNSSNISSTVLLLSTGEMIFSGGSSTFRVLTALSGGSMEVNANLSTTHGAMSLVGNQLEFADGITLDSASTLLLRESGDKMTGAGALTLNSIGDMNIEDSLETSGVLTINTGLGILDLGSNTISSNDSLIDLTLGDINIGVGGGVNSGAAATQVTDGSGNGIGLGLSMVPFGLNFSDSELTNFTASDLSLTTTGSISADSVLQPNNIANQLILNATGNGSVVAFTGGDSVFRSLAINATDGVDVLANLTTTIGSLEINADSDANDDIGTFTLGAGNALVSSDQQILITADSLNALGTLNSGAESVTIQDSDGDGIDLGGVANAGRMHIANSNLQNITSNGLFLITSGSMTVDGISQPNSIGGTTTLSAQAITFQNNNSEFTALDARADNGVAINVGVNTTIGNLSIDGDANDSVDGNDDVTIANGVLVVSKGLLTLQATSGSLVGSGDLILAADDGITLNDSLSTVGQVILLADNDPGDQTGTLTIASGETVNSGGNEIIIAANDVDLGGGVNSGAADTIVQDTDGDGIGLGDAVVTNGLNLNLTDVQDITAANLQIRTAGNIEVEGFIQPGTISGGVILEGFGAASSVVFNNAASDFNALEVLANEGVMVNTSVSVNNAALSINADVDSGDNSGSLSVSAGGSLSSNGGNISITANDVDIQGSIISGAGSITLADSDGTGVGLGNTSFAGGLNLGGSELQNLTSTGLIISTSGNLTVDNITSANSAGITGTTSLQTSQQAAFVNNDSFFHSLEVLAIGGISVSANLSTVTGDLLIDGDDDLQFSAGVQLEAAGQLTLEASNGINGAGNLTLEAASGVNLNSAMTLTGSLSIDADTDQAGNDGNLAIGAGASILSNNNQITIRANDVDVNGVVNAGNSAVSIIDSDGDGIGLGDTPVSDGLNLSNSDLQSFFSGDFHVTTDGDVTADGVITPISITGTTQISSGMSIEFINQDSFFTALTGLAADGIQIDVNLTASSGDLVLDGDSNLISEGNDRIRFAAGTFLQSAGAISLQANSLGMVGDGELDLYAADGVALNSNLNTSGQLSINADQDANDNAGTLIISSGASVSSGDHLIAIVANDLDLQGTLDSGSAAVTISDSDGNGIGLGDTAAANGLNISGGELSNLTATGLTLSSGGYVTIDNIAAADSSGIDSTTQIESEQAIQFLYNASTFNAISALASRGIGIGVNLTTVAGDLALDGDADNLFSDQDYIVMADGVSLLSADRLSLDATTGALYGAAIVGIGSLDLTAANGVSINDSLTTFGALNINADAVSGDNNGTLTIASGAQLNTSNNLLTIRADDLSIAGSVDSGTATTQIGDSDGGGIGFGNTGIAGGLNIDNTDLQSFVAGALTLDTAGDILVDGMTPPPTIAGNTTLNATGVNSTVSFENTASVFNSLVVQSSSDVLVDADVTTLVGDIQVTAASAFSVISGQSLAAAGDDTALTISAQSVSIGSGLAGSESLRNTGTGTITVSASGSGVDLENHSIGSESGLISVDSAGAITDVSDNTISKINSLGTVTLSADGAIGEAADALNLNVAAVSAEARSSGGIFLEDSGELILVGLTTTQGDIEVETGAAMSVSSPIVSQSTGDISLTGPTITLSATGDVSTANGTITIDASNGNGLSVSNDTVFTTHAGQISGSLINAANPFEGTGNTGEPLSDSNREAVINVVLPDGQSRNVGIEIDWSEGDPDDSTTVSGPAPGDPRAQVVSSVVTNGAEGTSFIHRYDQAPDPDNPSADIDIRLTITEFAAGTIDLFTGGSSVLELSKFDSQSIIVEVSAPILPFFFALPETDDEESAPSTVPFLINIPEPQRTFPVEAPQTLNNSIGTTQQTDQRYYVLRIVTFGSEGEVQLIQEGQEYRLRDLEDPESESGFELSQLPELFKRLPDDRYRIYLIEGETERLVLDFEIRDGQPIEAQSDETSSEEPKQAPTDAETDESPRPVDEEDQPSLELELPAAAIPVELDGPTGKSVAERIGSAPLVSAGGVLLMAGMKKQRPVAWRGHLRPLGTGSTSRTDSRTTA